MEPYDKQTSKLDTPIFSIPHQSGACACLIARVVGAARADLQQTGLALHHFIVVQLPIATEACHVTSLNRTSSHSVIIETNRSSYSTRASSASSGICEVPGGVFVTLLERIGDYVLFYLD
ncbi:hypothetical protein BV898_04479 [Hypsibius exemplaris]|uniref:Uncharacterized protein n=1 Tax=Hypsibius exemplaris TaxID=2072580 RepID=A0A1W0X249_HYPEX|nr:hypothetical protein BV898_04479 [Hypsibius exemplaris]